ncbi:hypothetical protein K9N68_10490 [Kovacikia minuta CCNUW1]|uniref:hypothetical protein n=1 Tax=Kovacikia minuta TaxID=2931930 RepID=UPI001CCB2A95|nr:hypothetical protein [Kovacikia minuta]UBF28263.1 hypothetical protein K9N68_10490 [Kovacikia minuta CCNUW1]
MRSPGIDKLCNSTDRLTVPVHAVVRQLSWTTYNRDRYNFLSSRVKLGNFLVMQME